VARHERAHRRGLEHAAGQRALAEHVLVQHPGGARRGTTAPTGTGKPIFLRLRISGGSWSAIARRRMCLVV
jgi:hypothetical protein